MPTAVTCTTYCRLEELQDLVPAWQRLWATDPQATPFQSPEWLLPWARQFAHSELRTIFVYDRGALAAILPFYRYLDPQTGQRQCLILGAGTSDYLDGVYSSSCSADHIWAALRVLCCEDNWDVMNVLQLRGSSKLGAALVELQYPGLRRLPAEACSRFAAMSLAELPKSIRKQAQYYHRRALRAGRLEFRIAGEDNWPEMFDALERLHTSRWASSGQTGLFSDPRVIAWHREALPDLLRSGMLRLVVLILDGESIAAIYSLLDPPSRSQRTLYLYMTAYSIRHAELRPGTVLTALAVDHAAREGIATIDLLRGDEPYKQLWHATRVPTYGFSMPHIPRSPLLISHTRSSEEAA